MKKGGEAVRACAVENAHAASIGDLLRLMGSGANGPILLALDRQPTRTESLAREICHYTPRTVYRYLGKLVEAGLVVKEEEEDAVPSVVTYHLSREGLRLREVIDAFGSGWLPRSPDGEIYAESWAALAVLADLWDLRILTALSERPRTPVHLSRACHGLNAEQVARRTSKLEAAQLLGAEPGAKGGKRFSLTSQARRGMAWIAALARWRRRINPNGSDPALCAVETATILATVLPLVRLPELGGLQMVLAVESDWDSNQADGELVGARSDFDGLLHFDQGAVAEADGWARGRSDDWLAAVLDGDASGLRMGGANDLIETFLEQLHGRLCTHGAVTPDAVLV